VSDNLDPMDYARQLDAHRDQGAPPPPGYTPLGLRTPDAHRYTADDPPPPAAQQPPATGQGETLEALEARLKAQHDQRLRDAKFETERPANEELLRRALGSNYRPVPKADNTEPPPPMTRRDGSPLTPADLKLAAEMQRLHPNIIDWTGARTPPGHYR
jgi:hypothetical protein